MLDRIEVRDLRLWAHVGVLPQEQEHGQWFSVDLSLALDLAAAARGDDLAASCDYSLAVRSLQHQARHIRCRTLEHYSACMLDQLEALYGELPMRLRLVKLQAPIPGFSGSVAVECRRRWPAELDQA